jgi:hypothetical protein
MSHPFLTIRDGQFELIINGGIAICTADPHTVARYIVEKDIGFFQCSSSFNHPEEYGMSVETVNKLDELLEQRTSDYYKTFLSPLHRELINRGLQIVEEAEPLWGLEDRERAEESELVSLRLPVLQVAVLKEFARRAEVSFDVLVSRWLDDRIRSEVFTSYRD